MCTELMPLDNMALNRDWDAPQLDDDQGRDLVKAKWGKEKGWHSYCVYNLRLACEASIASDDPSCISSD